MKKNLVDNLRRIEEGFGKNQVERIEVTGNSLKITFKDGTRINIFVRDIIKEQ